MIRRTFSVVTCSLIASVTHAAALPSIAFLSIGFREATVTDFKSTPQELTRRADESGFLAVTADFDGDGKADEARILLNEKRGVAYVVAVIQSAAKVDTYVLSQMPLPDANNVGITLARPLTGAASRGSAGILIFALDSGLGEASYFDGEEFNTRVAAPGRDSNSSQGKVR